MENVNRNESLRSNSFFDEDRFGPTHFGIVPHQREIRPMQGLTLVALGALAILVGVAGLLGTRSSDRDGH